jgi:hypothetical protein
MYVFNFKCVRSCPEGYTAAGGTCNAAISPSSSKAGLITGVVIGVLGIVGVAVFFRMRLLRRQAELEQDLRSALLDSQKEGSGCHHYVLCWERRGVSLSSRY